MHHVSLKQEIRATALASRAAMTQAERDTAGRAIRDALLTLPEIQMAGVVAGYVSVGTEPDTRGLLFALWKRGTYVLLPRLLPDGDLDWASYEGPDSLTPGPYGLLEPSDPSEPDRGVAAVARADAVIVPALRVDRGGVRLGRGRGCYDRALSRVGPQVLTVSPIYDPELVDELPAESHDRPVRAVVTPSRGLVRFG